jgi:hypothetical protein
VSTASIQISSNVSQGHSESLLGAKNQMKIFVPTTQAHSSDLEDYFHFVSLSSLLASPSAQILASIESLRTTRPGLDCSKINLVAVNHSAFPTRLRRMVIVSRVMEIVVQERALEWTFRNLTSKVDGERQPRKY